MAHKFPRVLLGFEDELITEKHKNSVNSTTNKMGGKPDWPESLTIKDSPMKCPLCQLPRPLVVQIYAPLETTVHRTLYVFACINPNCWNQADSWVCVRTNDEIKEAEENLTGGAMSNNFTLATDWCADADNWDDEEDNNANNIEEEENGNVVINSMERISDDDESCSFEESIRAGLGNLTVDDRNANNGGAVGRLQSPSASAEIEGDEGEVICIDSPTMPQNDLAALLQEVTPLPQELYHSRQTPTHLIQFIPSFISVWEESHGATTIMDTHVKELLQEYQQKNAAGDLKSPEGAASAPESEKYEKSAPAHGDKMFHHFLSRIQTNPGQIVRYSRDQEGPLLLYPMSQEAVPKKCHYCHGDLVFELQILPTIIPKLKLALDQSQVSRLEFGTVAIFTCQKSCFDSGQFRYETVVVQSENY